MLEITGRPLPDGGFVTIYMDVTARQLAEELCGGRLVFALEGGYAASGLEEGTSAVLEAALRPQPYRVAAVEAPPGSVLGQLVEAVVAVHGRRIRDLGAA